MKIGNKTFTPIQLGILALTAATAIIHFAVGGSNLPGGLLLLFNGFGYVALFLGLYILPQTAAFRKEIRWVYMGYTVVTIVLFFVMNAGSGYGTVGLIDKAIEVVLLVLLWQDGRS